LWQNLSEVCAAMGYELRKVGTSRHPARSNYFAERPPIA
jgi:hypothetical protein